MLSGKWRPFFLSLNVLMIIKLNLNSLKKYRYSYKGYEKGGSNFRNIHVSVMKWKQGNVWIYWYSELFVRKNKSVIVVAVCWLPGAFLLT